MRPDGDERIAASAEERSLHVIRRFACKVGLFALFCCVPAALGHGFARHLASLALASAIGAIVIAHLRQEHVWAAHYTYVDEAVWFLLLAFILRAWG